MLPRGIYVLTRDVQNPHPPQLVSASDWRVRPWWFKGTEFVSVSITPGSPSLRRLGRPKAAPLDMLVMVGSVRPHWGVGFLRQDLRYDALHDSLAPCDGSTDAFLQLEGVTDEFARWLLRSGRVDRDLLIRLWASYGLVEDLNKGRVTQLVEWPRP